jgi:hypothetical protein
MYQPSDKGKYCMMGKQQVDGVKINERIDLHGWNGHCNATMFYHAQLCQPNTDNIQEVQSDFELLIQPSCLKESECDERTLLRLALNGDDLPMASFLITNGANVKVTNKYGQSLLEEYFTYHSCMDNLCLC